MIRVYKNNYTAFMGLNLGTPIAGYTLRYGEIAFNEYGDMIKELGFEVLEEAVLFSSEEELKSILDSLYHIELCKGSDYYDLICNDLEDAIYFAETVAFPNNYDGAFIYKVTDCDGTSFEGDLVWKNGFILEKNLVEEHEDYYMTVRELLNLDCTLESYKKIQKGRVYFYELFWELYGAEFEYMNIKIVENGRFRDVDLISAQFDSRENLSVFVLIDGVEHHLECSDWDDIYRDDKEDMFLIGDRFAIYYKLA